MLSRRSLMTTVAAMPALTLPQAVQAAPEAASKPGYWIRRRWVYVPEPDHHIHALAREAVEAGQTWKRSRDQITAAADAGADGESLKRMERQDDQVFKRMTDLEHALRTAPAATLAGVLFKLKHLVDDCTWPDCEDLHREPVEQAIGDLEQIAAVERFNERGRA